MEKPAFWWKIRYTHKQKIYREILSEKEVLGRCCPGLFCVVLLVLDMML